jgi:hypothetical protein
VASDLIEKTVRGENGRYRKSRLGRVDELTDGTGGSVNAVMGAAIDP